MKEANNFPTIKVNVKDLIPYARNSRTHSENQVKQICSSISEFGFTNPIIIDEDKNIIAGHGRILASEKLNMDEVPCVQVSGWSEAQKKAYVIADNKLALNAGWDEDMLRLEFDDLKEMGFDLEMTGFSMDEISELNPVEEEIEEDEAPEPPENPTSQLGDIWLLGNHRVMCGDSTDAGSVALLMNGEKADMVFTDPPYNIDYKGLTNSHDKIKNDKMSDDDFVEFLEKSVMGCETMYVCCSWQYSHLFKKAMENISRKPKAMIVWDKVNPAQNLDKYYKQHEIIFYYGDFGGQKTLRGDVWTLKRQKNTVHPTMKPLELIGIALSDQPNKKLIYDGFLASGSTLIACEQTSRKCNGMELDPKYVDVIIERWQNLTGKSAILDGEDKTFEEMKGVRS